MSTYTYTIVVTVEAPDEQWADLAFNDWLTYMKHPPSLSFAVLPDNAHCPACDHPISNHPGGIPDETPSRPRT